MCRRQECIIEALTEAVSVLRGGAAALKAENADLRAGANRAQNGGSARGRTADAEGHTVSVPLDMRAPAAARTAVEGCLRGRVAASVLANAALVVSELATNSVRHSGAAADGVVIIRVQLTDTSAVLEIEDSGRRGVVAPRVPDPVEGGGFGLNIVQTLSERWGFERGRSGGTRVWAQLPREPRRRPAVAGSR